MSEIEDLKFELNMEREKLAYLNQYFNGVINSMIPAIILTDEDLFINSINSSVSDLMGYSLDDMEGMPLSEFITHDRVRADLSEEEIKELHGFETEILINNNISNTLISFQMSFSVIKYANGEVEGLVCILSDLTERKKLENQLLQSQKLESVGQLAAGIAHEINTPIQYIRDNMVFFDEEYSNIIKFINYIKKLEEESPKELFEKVNSQYKENDIEYLINEIPSAIKQTLEGAEAVAKIVRSMKDFSHPGTEELVATDVNRAIESTVTVSASEWKYIADLKLNLDENLPHASCFPSDLNQVLLNLIVNAAHAIQDVKKKNEKHNGLIEISTKSENNKIIVVIKDNGTGIPKEIQEQVFNPFFTTKEVGKGTGQGLSFVYNSVVERQSGNVYFKTGCEGTSFIIELNIAE